MRQIAGVFISGVFLFFAGCASNWQVTQQSHTNAKYSIQTPSQWMIIHEGTTTILSRHGPILESIRILSHSLQDTLPHTRSEEHTSELQSRPHLVCRLLLEKK